jgi:hypothetical protein
MPSERLELELSDLRELIRTLGKVSPDPRTVGQALEAVGLYGLQSHIDGVPATELWHSAVKVALDNGGTHLRSLLAEACARLPEERRRKIGEAVYSAGIAYVERALFPGNNRRQDQVENLSCSRTYAEIRTAARDLRNMGLDARRMLMDPQLGTELALQLGIDPERTRDELVNLAIDVVTATDYLLWLADDKPLQGRTGLSAEKDLGAAALPSDPAGRSAEDDLRYRRVLDARAVAVRLGGELLRELRSATVAPLPGSS